MPPIEASNPNALAAVPDIFTIYSVEHKAFASRNGDFGIRVSKRVVDGYCYMRVTGREDTNKIRFRLDSGAVVFRHSEVGNLHSRMDGQTNSDTLFEIVPRPDGTYFIKANNGLFVSAYDSGGLLLRASKKDADVHCVFLIRDPNNSGSLNDIKKVSTTSENEAEVTEAQVEA
ncbi:hypothetical protein BGZ80_006548 [Entomortierella chlamydospora]|uniref:Fascin domain-containing protein n=1 Tax=Entomortierella chlamydospora TaxID=101097 RepID=A0A9P6N045_9FUNG|nr:hypothetical protein BGZ79_007943 [Entomortierella chlamydospora]KAG0018920.1 hypothetical protein BGZ80_006548 [Entomortierella chlamydospora]